MPAFSVLSYGALGNPVTVPNATITSPVVPTLYKNVHGFSVEIAVPQVALWQMNGGVDVWEATPPGTPPALFFGRVISLAPGQNGAGTIMVFSASAPTPPPAFIVQGATVNLCSDDGPPRARPRRDGAGGAPRGQPVGGDHRLRAPCPVLVIPPEH